MVHIIPIGIDCGVAQILRQNGYRNTAFPFDWNVSYGGVSQCIQHAFEGFIPENTLCNKYGVWFMHDVFPESIEKYIRRIERFVHLLQTTTEEVVFIRKCHASHNHKEEHSEYLCDEIQDAIQLETIVHSYYPALQFKIVVMLICNECYTKDTTITLHSNRILLYNIVSEKLCDEDKLKEVIMLYVK